MEEDWRIEAGRLTPVSDTTVRSAFSESDTMMMTSELQPKRGPGRPKGSTNKKLTALEALFDDPNVITGLSRRGLSNSTSEGGEIGDLLRACQYGQIGLVEAMIGKDRMDVNCRDASLNTPLHEAAAYNQSEMVRFLLKMGADCSAQNVHKKIPASLSTMVGITTILEDFSRTDKDATSHSVLAEFWRTKTMDRDDVDFDINTMDDCGNGALHYAAIWDNLDLATLLINKGVNVNAQNLKGNTALHEASRYSSPEVFKLLLESNALYSIENASGNPPIYYANKNLRRIFRKFAKEHGIDDVEMLDLSSTKRTYDEENDEEEDVELGSKRLVGLSREERKLQQMLAIFSRSTSKSEVGSGGGRKKRGRPPRFGAIVSTEEDEEATPPRKNRTLPASKPNRPKLDPSYMDKSSGRTQLHKVASKGQLEDVSALIGMDKRLVKRKDNAGYLPIHEACLGGHFEIVKVLVEAGSSINVASDDGDTPLHDAVENGHVEIVKYLLAKGADVRMKNKNGLRPIDVTHDKEMVTMLRSGTKPKKNMIAESESELDNATGSTSNTPRRSSRRTGGGNPVETGLDSLFGNNLRKNIEIVTSEPLVQLHCGANDTENAGWYYLGAQTEALFYRSFPPLRLQDNIPLSKRRHLTTEETDKLLESALAMRLGNFRKYLQADGILLDKDSVQRAFDRAGGSLSNVPVLYADLQRLVKRSIEGGGGGGEAGGKEDAPHLPPKLKMKWQRKTAENPA